MLGTVLLLLLLLSVDHCAMGVPAGCLAHRLQTWLLLYRVRLV
jgi:hypothetical protein